MACATMGAEVGAPPPAFSKPAVVAFVARRSGPHLIEATVVPAVLFYGCLLAGGLNAAYVSALAWSYTALARRVLSHRPVPPILVLGVIGITVRTVVAVVSRSSFAYFFQPVLGTIAMGCVFLLSVVVGRPFIGRLAGDTTPRPFRYRDVGRLAMISRFRAVAVVGTLAVSGLPAWVLWLLVRLTSLTGFKNRASVLFNWTVAFLGRGRAHRVISAQQVFARQALEVHARDAANEPALSTAAHAEGATP